MNSSSKSSTRTYYILVICILLVAFFFRFYRLAEVPPGMTHDEASVGFFVKQIANNTGFVIDAPYGYANEPFTKYSASLLMYGIGQTEWALRVHQAFWGVLLVVMTLKWGTVAFSRNIGVAASAFVAVSFWGTMTSRFALNSNPAPALFTGAMWLMWVALFKEKVKRRWLAWIGFSILLAASLMTYEASRGAWLSLPVFILYLLVTNQRKRLPQFIFSLTLGTTLALPHLLNPAAWGRTNTLSVPLGEAAKGNLMPMINNGFEALGTLFIKGDPFVVYNIPNRPVLDCLTGVLLVFGVVICLWRWRQPAFAFSLLWFGAGFAPAAAIGAFTMMLHAITTQAVVMLLPVVTVDVLAARFKKFAWWGLALLFGITAVINFNDYFYKWGDALNTRSAYFANFRGVTEFMRKTTYKGSVTLSSPFPGLPHDPLVVDMRLRRNDLDLRWFDARESLVFPQTKESLLIIPVNAQPDPFFASRLPLKDAKRTVVRADDIDPYFETVLWNPQATLEQLLNDKAVTPLNPPGNFGGAVELIAFSIPAATAKGGDTVNVIAFWRVLDPNQLGERALVNYAPEANLFLHAINSEGNLIAGSDRLHVPAWNWHSGDTFAQIHRLVLPKDARGTLRLTMGIYTLPDLSRLPYPDGEADTIYLTSIQVVP